jgi:hypothetical protein
MGSSKLGTHAPLSHLLIEGRERGRGGVAGRGKCLSEDRGWCLALSITFRERVGLDLSEFILLVGPT